jgi:BirA family biotin operon repressor/biotin-[acetyl-CoA-carboxylase] ligase
LSVWRVEVCEELPSTSTACVARAEAGEPAGLAILALRQSAGRGSRGRSWQSPPGNLALSVLIRPGWPVARAGFLSLLAGVAVAEALGALGAAPRLKWPNDILIEDAKLGGILIDAVPEGGRIAWAVIGIGLNLAYAPGIPGRATTSLAAHGMVMAPRAMADAILGRLDIWLAASPAAIRAAWLSHGHPAGTALEVSAGGATRSGLFSGLSEDGALLLDTPAGQERINTGEIMLSAV